MSCDHEIMDFEADSHGSIGEVHVIDEGLWAPMWLRRCRDYSDVAADLRLFLQKRAIGRLREDLSRIMEAIGASSPVDLALRAGGFSLTDQYWYRPEGSSLSWAEANFFDNGWDPAFGDAVLAQDYQALARASLLTPDVTCGGRSPKAWVEAPDGPRLLKASARDDGADLVGESLVSRMLGRLLGPDDFIHYELIEAAGQRFISCPGIIARGEELVHADQIVSRAARAHYPSMQEGFGLWIEAYVRALKSLGVGDWRKTAAKLAVCACLSFNADMHLGNLAVIRKPGSDILRAAPLMDFTGGFGTFDADHSLLACSNPTLLIILIAQRFSYLDPAWDYSWYDPHALDGFDDELRLAFERAERAGAVPAGFAELICLAFKAQLSYVNEVAM